MMEGKSLKDYWHEAKRVIGKWGKWEWQKDDECVAFVSYWMMRADWKYDPDKGAKRSTYRISSGRWALVSWAGKLKKRDAKAKLTADQQRFHALWKGGPLHVIWSEEQVEAILLELERGAG